MRYQFTGLGVAFAVFAWVVGVSVHGLFFQNPASTAVVAHHVILRMVLMALIVALGLMADYHTMRCRKRREEELALYHSTLGASQHILNNFLNHANLVVYEAKKGGAVDRQIIANFERHIFESAGELARLELLKPATGKEVDEAVYPRNPLEKPEPSAEFG